MVSAKHVKLRKNIYSLLRPHLKYVKLARVMHSALVGRVLDLFLDTGVPLLRALILLNALILKLVLAGVVNSIPLKVNVKKATKVFFVQSAKLATLEIRILNVLNAPLYGKTYWF